MAKKVDEAAVAKKISALIKQACNTLKEAEDLADEAGLDDLAEFFATGQGVMKVAQKELQGPLADVKEAKAEKKTASATKPAKKKPEPEPEEEEEWDEEDDDEEEEEEDDLDLDEEEDEDEEDEEDEEEEEPAPKKKPGRPKKK